MLRIHYGWMISEMDMILNVKCLPIRRRSHFQQILPKIEYYDIRVHIANGKIIPNGGMGKSTGSIVDSIYMEASFGDDPGDTYIISGVARSRWATDDYN